VSAYAIPLLLAAILVVVILLLAEARHVRASLDALAELLGEAIDTWRGQRGK
jgi:hypothetical protein